MKTHLLIAAALLLASCDGPSDSDKKAVYSTADAVVQIPPSAVPADTASAMIAELERLQRVLEADDKTALAGFYDFPLSPEECSLFIEPSAPLGVALKSNGPHLTAADFTKFFDEVKEARQYALLLKVLKKLKVQDLQRKSELNAEDHPNGEACYTHYNIQKGGKECSITYGTNSNPDYDGPDGDEEGGCAEFSCNWLLELKGGKLKLVRLLGLGNSYGCSPCRSTRLRQKDNGGHPEEWQRFETLYFHLT